jgi:hypothetical protein
MFQNKGTKEIQKHVYYQYTPCVSDVAYGLIGQEEIHQSYYGI